MQGKYVREIVVEFANPKVMAKSYAKEIKEAAIYASHNLELRHHITVDRIYVSNSNEVVIRLYLPKDYVNFSYGSHLKGISVYLLKHYPELKHFKVGTRLLTFSTKHLDWKIKDGLSIKDMDDLGEAIEKILLKEIKPAILDACKMMMGENMSSISATQYGQIIEDIKEHTDQDTEQTEDE